MRGSEKVTGHERIEAVRGTGFEHQIGVGFTLLNTNSAYSVVHSSRAAGFLCTWRHTSSLDAGGRRSSRMGVDRKVVQIYIWSL